MSNDNNYEFNVHDFEFYFISADPLAQNHIRKLEVVDKYELDYLLHQRNEAFRLLEALYVEMHDNIPIATSCESLEIYRHTVMDIIKNHKHMHSAKNIKDKSIFNKIKIKLFNIFKKV